MQKVLLADDHPIMRTGIKTLIKEQFDVILEADNGLDAYKIILAQQPDIAIIDYEMPKLNGLDVCRKVLAEKNYTRFIILTSHKEKKYFDEAMNCGVLGYLHKDRAIMELLDCINSVKNGEVYTNKKVKNALENSLENNQILENLTPTEKLILKLITQGYTSTQIATEIFISLKTVENHRSNIAKKLNLEGKNSLVKFSLENRNIF